MSLSLKDQFQDSERSLAVALGTQFADAITLKAQEITLEPSKPGQNF